MDLSVLLLSSTIHSLCGSESDSSKHKSNYVTWYKPSNNYFTVLLINPNVMLWPMWPYVNWPWSTSLLSSLTSACHTGCLLFPSSLGILCAEIPFPFFGLLLTFHVFAWMSPFQCSSPWQLYLLFAHTPSSILHGVICIIFSTTLFSVWIVTVWITSLYSYLFMLLYCCSVVQSCPTRDPMDASTPGLPVSHHLLEFVQVHVISDAVQSSHPLTPSFPSALNLSQYQGLFQWVSVCIRRPKYWRFSFSCTPSSEYSGFFSLKIDWFDLLAVQGTLSSLLQNHSAKFFGALPSLRLVPHSQPYVTTGSTIALIMQTFVGRVMALLFNTLSRFVNICSCTC